MTGNLFHIGLHVPGTLTANATRRFRMPWPATLVAVSAYTDNALTFILDIGTAASASAYLATYTVTGVTSTTTLIGQSSFVGGEYPHLAAASEVLITVDYDGGAGNDSANVNVDLYFREG